MSSAIANGTSATRARLWGVGLLTAASAVGASNHAQAAMYYWSDYPDPYYYARPSRTDIDRPRPRKRTAAPVKKDVVEKQAGANPQGPLLIAISVDRQKVTIYDSNGVFAESPVSTGMKGHPTPMGVFSVIQKHKFHHSNIYSGAPMPYMQRITWSGIAMHAGVLPGYPASHGCIRMPMAFAVKMWNWTKMGARVLVTPGELAPESFSHPLLTTLRVPQPTAAIERPAKSDKTAKAASESTIPTNADTAAMTVKSASAEPLAELRTTLGHAVMSDATTGGALVRDDAAVAGPTASMTEATVEKSADKAEAPKSDQAGVVKPDEVKTAPAAGTPAMSDALAPSAPSSDAGKDQTRVADPAPASKPEAPKSRGQIAAFISRKDAKIYVRQNFAPLFEAPVTIAASERPLGTHVFTAEVDRKDSNALHWSVVSLPTAGRIADKDEDSHLPRRQRLAGILPVSAKPVIRPDRPAEALDRITVPPDVMARINEMLTTGGSIIVSDQGINQGETGEGTDFIVRMR